MKRFLMLSTIFLLVSGCMKTANIPPASIEFISIKGGASDFLRARFSSNLELTTVFDVYAKADQFAPTLTCALSDDENFSADHRLKLSATGEVILERATQKKNRFDYVALLSLEKSYNHVGSTNADIPEVEKSLATMQNIVCKVVVIAYGFKAYYTGTMLMPKEDFLRELKK